MRFKIDRGERDSLMPHPLPLIHSEFERWSTAVQLLQWPSSPQSLALQSHLSVTTVCESPLGASATSGITNEGQRTEVDG